ncbi:hypothetical protein BASA50_007453 [Batrachochytrium salamandrivorans]|uniref:HORMA domain-containing protein n=1 Tax=Batrachochytrium salamandrivorans TaxID=1357716 RepID=A0ABQ8FA22_9FUNG|nr:hypothetical protein BASA50_007453 [Batrachochytrium salamandrivorans]
MGVPINSAITQAMERLLELAGTAQFLPEFSCLQIIVLRVKWAREGRFNIGYTIPWTEVHSAWGQEPLLKDVATRVTYPNQRTSLDFSNVLSGMSPYSFSAQPPAADAEVSKWVSAADCLDDGELGSSAVAQSIAWLFGSCRVGKQANIENSTKTIGLNPMYRMDSSAENSFGNGSFPAEVNLHEVAQLGLFKTLPSQSLPFPGFMEIGLKMQPAGQPKLTSYDAVQHEMATATSSLMLHTTHGIPVDPSIGNQFDELVASEDKKRKEAVLTTIPTENSTCMSPGRS